MRNQISLISVTESSFLLGVDIIAYCLYAETPVDLLHNFAADCVINVVC